MLDLLICNATVYDGTGKEPFVADLGVKDGKIASIGKHSGDAAKTVDARGLSLAPGFIDSHSHTDASVFAYPQRDHVLRMGVENRAPTEGELDTFSKIPFISPTFAYKELGKMLSDMVVDCLKNHMKDVEVGPVKTTRTDFAAQIDHSDDHLAAEAGKSYDYRMSTNGKFVKENSPFEATMIFECANDHNDYLPSCLQQRFRLLRGPQPQFPPGDR